MEINRKDGRNAIVEEMLLVPGMKCNLLSVGQLIEKCFSIKMEDGSLKLVDPEK